MLRPCFHSCLIGEKSHWLSSRGESQESSHVPPPPASPGCFYSDPAQKHLRFARLKQRASAAGAISQTGEGNAKKGCSPRGKNTGIRG